MVKHIVLFSLSEALSEKEKYDLILEIRSQFEALPAAIPCLRRLRILENINPQEEYDIALIAYLDSFSSVGKYAHHPAHTSLVERYIAPHVSKRACVDIAYPCDTL